MKKYKRSKSSRKEPLKGKKKFFSKRMIWSLGLALIMFMSVVGFMYTAPSDSEYGYNNVTFSPVFSNNGVGSVSYWVSTINDVKVTFYNHPQELALINISSETKDILKNSKIFYLTSDYEDPYKEDISLVNFNLINDLSLLDFIFIVGFDSDNMFNKPVITCENATRTLPVIYFKSGVNNSITSDDSCIKIDFSNQLNLKRLKDKLLLVMLGIEE